MKTKKSFVIILSALLFLLITNGTALAAPIVADHTSVQAFTGLSPSEITSVKSLTILNIGQSHGQQVPHGLEMLETSDATYGVTVFNTEITGVPNGTLRVGRALRMADNSWQNYIGPDQFWSTTAGMNNVRRTLDYYNSQGITIDAILHTWCWHLRYENSAYITGYISAINQLQSEYPEVEFLFMTDTDDSYGAEGYNRWQRNTEIRNYVNTNSKVLFDYGEMETWSSDGLAQNTYSYSGYTVPVIHGDWTGSPEYAHIKETACLMKAKAMWWLLANLNGSDGPGCDIGIYRTGSYPNWFMKLSNGDNMGGATWPLSWGNAGGDRPFTGDFDGNGKDDIAVYRTGSYPNWFFNLSKDDGSGFSKGVWPLSWGNAGGDTPFVGDFNGDGYDDIGIYRINSYPNWFILLSKGDGTGFYQTYPEQLSHTWALSWGNRYGDIPIIGDFDGNGTADVGVYRYGSYPNWFFLRTKTDGTGFMTPDDTWPINWGNAGGDTPLVGDFDGNGCSDIGVYRTGSYPNWFVLRATGTGFMSASQTWSVSWGNAGGDRPITGNFNGDKNGSNEIDDIGVYRTGSYPNWFFLKSKSDGTGFPAPAGIPAATWSLSWGNAGGDTPICGDFNGDL